MRAGNIPSLVLVTSVGVIQKNDADILHFFNSIDVVQKDIMIFSPKPILDYSTIKKIPANEMVILHQKDFFPFQLFIKPEASKILRRKSYTILIHFNEEKFLRNTYLMAKIIPASIKITNTVTYSKYFSVVIQDKEKFFKHVLDYLTKVVI